MANASVKLRIENLTKTFGSEVAVDDLSMTIEQGQLKSLLGPSGCGKTTTLRCVAGLETADSGQIYIDDDLVSAPEEGVNVDPKQRGIGMVFQSYAVWPHMTVEQNVRYPLKVRKIGSEADRRAKVRDVLKRVGLEPYASNLATNLSGGQQQRVAIARALVVEPELLLFDEPLSNLDAKLRRDMRLDIKDLYQEFDTTVLYVTHSQDEAMFLSDEIAIMLDGKIVEEGDPVELHTNPMTFFGMNFMGQCNTYRGRIAVVDQEAATVETKLGELHVDTGPDSYRIDDAVFLCFRPKNCRILAGDSQVNDGEYCVEGTVDMRAATRDFIEYRVSVNGASLLARTTDPVPLDEGDPIRIGIDQEEVRVFPMEEGRRIVESGQADVFDAETSQPESAERAR